MAADDTEPSDATKGKKSRQLATRELLAPEEDEVDDAPAEEQRSPLRRLLWAALGLLSIACLSLVTLLGNNERSSIAPPRTNYAADASALPRTITLSNGVEMPRLLLGTGATTWMNETTTQAMVTHGLRAGFLGIDTANHYRNHRGVARGIAAARAAGDAPSSVWLQTKIEGCGNSLDPRSPVRAGSCYRDTAAVFSTSLMELEVQTVDLALLHSPPCVPGATWVEACIGNPAADLVYPQRCDCAAPEPCAMMQQQWAALEDAYLSNRTRAIGVSNYCADCLRCIGATARVRPHVNQLNFHAGMPGDDPAGLMSESGRHGARVQAYRPLAHGEGSLLHDPLVRAIGHAHGKSSAQVALRWVLQLGHALVTSTESESHMLLDLDVFDWRLNDEAMGALAALNTSRDVPTPFCVLGDGRPDL